jgi:hypothetical protein
MDKMDFKILPVGLLDDYLKAIDKRIAKSFDSLTDSELSAGTFSFYTQYQQCFLQKLKVRILSLILL